MTLQNSKSGLVTCLYIEPDADTIPIIKKQLEGWFGGELIKILHSPQLEPALEALSVRTFDLIITDIHFQGSGLTPADVVRKIRAHPAVRETPLIALTELAAPQIASQAFEAGVDEYINLASATMQPRVVYHRIANLLKRIWREKLLLDHANESIRLIADFRAEVTPSSRPVDLSLRVGELELELEKSEQSRKNLENENNRLMRSFSMYVDPAVIKNVILGEEQPLYKGQRRDITLLFSDLRGYTRMSSGLSSEEIVSFLNEYYTAMTEVVMGYQGIVDKYMGDGMMCMFGAPLDDAEHALHAVEAAIEMQNVFELWQANWQRSYGIKPNQGIGLACGKAVVGNLGSFQKISYTAIGPVVNLAARLESLAEAGDIVISSDLHERVQHKIKDYQFEALPPIPIRGMDGRHHTWRLTKEIDLDEVLVEIE
ncbi:MAG: adenylate/guanylate cyclase domain-containing response regulator [Leptospiraceae bacterium]|nr:adenylate/guanylate cyclase domain-containing response regulator [Leptospiraceae bacterium]